MIKRNTGDNHKVSETPGRYDNESATPTVPGQSNIKEPTVESEAHRQS